MVLAMLPGLDALAEAAHREIGRAMAKRRISFRGWRKPTLPDSQWHLAGDLHEIIA